ncbi:longitudinals lacking protein, isoforms H/M/V-like isoform X4 [Lutzomyia longipalpis]|uniref:longitudinals lacking protein, isoforms H/M/V-like isoform X4 n=1 Tax=Lutzomyia longipalpis TaxID=7200 RepID=UPI00248467CA|nr:longitudinals lacking protein, isoforms H/M/V-like isoform X4 [Lutzomyia longipalpis]
MDDDQQFCLRWNNHQSTLISVFDTLLENGTLVDCTLAAEGKFLKAHKVVLSACSPYFAALLSQQYDKHPIFILKDVKFQELRAMMDYMYRGEVNISQDQLAALLKAAESLQIKGLSDSRGSSGSGGSSQKADTSTKTHASVPAAKQTSTGLTIEQKRPRIEKQHPATLDTEPDVSDSREGSTSPNSRKRKKFRRRSIETNNIGDNHDQHSNSSSHSMPHAALSTHTTSMPTITSATSSASVLNVTKKTDHQSHESKGDIERDVDDSGDARADGGETHPLQVSRSKQSAAHGGETESTAKDKMEHSTHPDMLLEPKNEYDESNDGNVEDLTLDDEELLEDLEQAGPSHGGGEGSSQGYAQWQIERSQDEVFMAGQEAAGQHRDAQEQLTCTPSIQFLNNDSESQRFFCNVCDKSYLRKRHLQRHMRDECIGIPPRFNCSMCPSKFRRKYHLVRHLNSKHGIVTPKMEPMTPNSSGMDISGMNNGSSQDEVEMYNRAISLIVPKKEAPAGGEAQQLDENMEIYNRLMNFEKFSIGGLTKKDDAAAAVVGVAPTEGATLADSIEIYNRLMNFDKFSAGAILGKRSNPHQSTSMPSASTPGATGGGNRAKRKGSSSPLPEDFQMKMNIQFKAAELPSATIKSPQLTGSTQPQKFVPNDMQ